MVVAVAAGLMAVILALAACESAVGGGSAPVFTGRAEDQSYTVGTAIATLTLPAATGGDGELTYTLTPVPGLSFDGATRTLSGTPTVAGEYEMTYAVADGDENTDASDGEELRFTITVAVANSVPEFTGGVENQSYTAGEAIAALTLPSAIGGDGALTYTLLPEVPGLSFDGATRTLSGTPTTAGEYEMTYAVADADGDQDSLTFNVNVVKSTIPPGPLPPDQFDAVADAVFERFNREREELGLEPFTRVRTSDASFDSFIEVWSLTISCQASLRDDLEELQRSDLHGIGFAPWTEGTECALEITTYHYLPVDRRMRVKDELWNCFKESRDIRDPHNNVSCSGRYSFIEEHVRWLPSEVSYTIVEGESHKGRFEALIPWVREKLGTTISKATSADDVRLSLHLGGTLPPGCGHSYGCNTLEEDPERGWSATIYIAAPDEFFDQVLKHELLHALLPMGHLPEGNYLMSVRPTDPSQTHTLSKHEEELLELYTHRYLRAGMRMDEFRRYLVIEP